MTAAPGTKLPNCALVTDLATNASIDSCDGDAAPAATMTVTTQVAVAAGDQVRVVFTGATNTDVAGLHTLDVSTSKGSVGSATYRLVPRGGAVSDVSVSVAPNVAGASRATYTVGFKASASGALVAGSGTITVTAAPGTKLPNCALVTDLATNASIDSCDGDAAPAATMTVTTQVAVAAGDQVRVVFTGATNGTQPGAYTLRVSTSTDAGGGARYDLVAPSRG